MAAAIPAGAVVTLLLRTDRLREGPHARRVGALLDGIRDWQAVLGGTEIDPIRDFDAVLLASANPVGTRAHPPDLMAIVRTHAGGCVERWALAGGALAAVGGRCVRR